jgi:hypothetical protein
VIPASIRNFHVSPVCDVTGWSRTKFWRKKIKLPAAGTDVVRFMQHCRKEEGLPPLTAAEEADVLIALVVREKAYLAELAKEAESAGTDFDREIAA